MLPLMLLMSCSSGPPMSGTPEFDKYLEQLMAEPYDPENGSKY